MNIKLSQTYSFCQIGERRNQEDARYPDQDVINRQQRFFVVCDGVGGSEKGEVASSTVCQSFADSLEHLDLEILDFGQQEFSEVLSTAYEALDAQASRASKDMGTTMTFVCFHQGGCMMAHIGDSRIYQVRPGRASFTARKTILWSTPWCALASYLQNRASTILRAMSSPAVWNRKTQTETVAWQRWSARRMSVREITSFCVPMACYIR